MNNRELDDDDDDETLLYSVVYCSRAGAHLGASDIEQIVSVARLHNARQHITGWLVYSSGIFFQWLEGGSDDVKRLMNAITADRRHDSVVVLSEAEEVRQRLFAEWDMELVSPEDIRDVLSDAIEAAQDRKSIDALQRLLAELDSKAIATG